METMLAICSRYVRHPLRPRACGLRALPAHRHRRATGIAGGLGCRRQAFAGMCVVKRATAVVIAVPRVPGGPTGLRPQTRPGEENGLAAFPKMTEKRHRGEDCRRSLAMKGIRLYALASIIHEPRDVATDEPVQQTAI